jgi:prepilin-type N-terminal cleavage/methylation domain-containing protein
MRTPSISRRRGFSLIELLIVISLMGVLGLMSMRRVSGMMTQWRVSRAAQAYAEELQSAFAIVGRDRKPVRIVLVMTNAPKKIELRITNRDQSVIYRRRSLGPTSAYMLDPTDISASSTDLLIFPPGLAADTLTVSFSRQSKFRRVRLLRGGLVQVCSNPSTVNGPCTPA